MKSRGFRKEDPRCTDQALIARFQAGEAKAFDTIVEKHWPGVTKLAAYRLHSEGAAEAEDVASEVFSALLAELPRWRGEANLYTWLYKATAHRCATRVQGSRRRRKISERIAAQSHPKVHHKTPEAEFQVREQSQRLKAALKKLSDRRRAVTVLHYCHGVSAKELAGTFNVAESTIKSTLNKSLKLLRGMFGLGDHKS